MYRVTDLPVRFARKIMPTNDGCWVWTGSYDSAGYGKVGYNYRSLGTHRVVYQLLIGPIRSGLTLDHLCRTPPCVNPAHLEPVTYRENVLRGQTLPAENAQKTHCIRGHEFDEANTYVTRVGKRQCIACDRYRKRRAQRLAAESVYPKEAENE